MIADDKVAWPDTPKGRVQVTPAALARMRERLAALAKAKPGTSGVLAVIWSEKRAMKRHGETEWTDLGPGLEIGFYETRQVPARIIETIDGVPIIFVYDTDFGVFDGKTVDFDGNRFSLRS